MDKQYTSPYQTTDFEADSDPVRIHDDHVVRVQVAQKVFLDDYDMMKNDDDDGREVPKPPRVQNNV
ncbi:hypothetical protein D9757_005032 [Collybiopsis confluens]|uniref:Uncharacterized protein n=1 Tax=Collybiopsis confluens TaxID=2823264 RepID=A0A8H5HSU6_9AGAR|nr:hypothetical protein D9757_005032 [Collybiopsis confluens]